LAPRNDKKKNIKEEKLLKGKLFQGKSQEEERGKNK